MEIVNNVHTAIRPKKIYVASSWRNGEQQAIVKALERAGHQVYDFRNPKPGDDGFHWSEIDHDWENWSNEQYRNSLDHPIAKSGFASDMDAMKWADTFLLVLPCGRSAHLEFGWACGQGKLTICLLSKMEPELMIKMADHICLSMEEVLETIA